MNRTKKRKALRYWLSQALQMLLILTVVSVAMDWYRTKDMPKERVMPLGTMTSNGVLEDMIAKSDERPIVIYFWSTWCSACKFVSPSVSWLSEHYPVIAVSAASGEQARVRQFMQSKGYQFDNMNDPNNQIMREWGIRVTPTIYILKDGEVSSITTGITTPIGILARLWMA